MARNSTQKPQEPNGTAPSAAVESIDQVRDLLFGSQMRAVDTRLQTLGDRLEHESAALRAAFEHKLSELDEAFRKELARQADRAAAERARRIEELEALNAELGRITAALQAEKLDASALVAGLTELAGRLGGSAQASGKRASRT
ncbi:MAG: hypothetical protein ACREOJ_08595 [Gemmatimonadaceae bacterium]